LGYKRIKKSCLLHDRLFLELGSFISAQSVPVQGAAAKNSSPLLFKSRVQLEVKTLQQPEMLLL